VPAPWSVVILSGGRSSRMGFDKATATVGERSLLEWVLQGLPAEVDCVLVGPLAPVTSRPVLATREEPAGGGPAAGIGAGVALVTTPIVAVVAVDMPLAAPVLSELVSVLASSPPQVDAVLARDGRGRQQPLAGAYRTAALRRAVNILDPLEGRSVRELVASLTIRIVQLPNDHLLVDVDSPDDLAGLRRSVRADGPATTREGDDMDDWVKAAAEALGLEQSVDVDLILDVAREAAHGVARPAAPVTTFLLGCAVGAGQPVEDAAARLTALAQRWPQPE